MKRSTLIFISVFCLAFFAGASSLVNASLIDVNCTDDGDGAIVMGTPAWTDQGTYYDVNVAGIQYDYPAHVLGDFTTDTELDPTVWLVESVENQTDFAWTDYHIDIGMNKTFTITGVIVPLDWTYIITPPTSGQPLPGDPSPGTGWVGYVDYYIGTGDAIGIGESGDFGLKFSFTGTVAFCTEQIPTPEPTTAVLLSLGGLALLRRRKK